MKSMTGLPRVPAGHIGVRDGGSGGGGQLTPQFGQIHDIYSGKRQHIFGQKTTHLFD